jgi:hypothetical protein
LGRWRKLAAFSFRGYPSDQKEPAMAMNWSYVVYSKDDTNKKAMVNLRAAGEMSRRFPGQERIDVNVSIDWPPGTKEQQAKERALARLQNLVVEQMTVLHGWKG